MKCFIVHGIIFVLTVSKLSAWTGHVCTRHKLAYTYRQECAYHCWWHCCDHRTIAEPHDVMEQYCCQGWTSDGNNTENCNEPICSPPCQNGGTCDRPFHCSCRSGYQGATCDDKIEVNTTTSKPTTGESSQFIISRKKRDNSKIRKL